MSIVIIGSGIGGITLAEEIRKLAPERPVTVITHETHGYYSRPMLSHGFSRSDIEEKILLRSFDALRATAITVLDGAEALAIDRAARCVSYRQGGGESNLTFDQLVLALGSEAFVPPPFLSGDGLYSVLNSLDDLLVLRRKRAACIAKDKTPAWAIIGGGLIGCELASDLAAVGVRVTLFHALPRLMERQLEEDDSATLAAVLTSANVELRLNSAVEGFRLAEGTPHVVLSSGLEPTAYDCIVVACGFKPRVALARDAGLSVNRGIRTNAFLATDDPSIFALGDVAEFADGRIYAYVLPIRSQALWLAKRLCDLTERPWEPPQFKPKAKVHGFTAAQPHRF
jgi:NAD(P)H-nitrite reductase large subunit